MSPSAVETIPRSYSTVTLRRFRPSQQGPALLIICRTVCDLTFMFDPDSADPVERVAIICSECFRRSLREEKKECPTCGTPAILFGNPGFLRTNSMFGGVGSYDEREASMAAHLEKWLLRDQLVSTIVAAKLIGLTLAQEFVELQKALSSSLRPPILAPLVPAKEQEAFATWKIGLEDLCRRFTSS